jgi:hypothetical protein
MEFIRVLFLVCAAELALGTGLTTPLDVGDRSPHSGDLSGAPCLLWARVSGRKADRQEACTDGPQRFGGVQQVCFPHRVSGACI